MREIRLDGTKFNRSKVRTLLVLRWLQEYNNRKEYFSLQHIADFNPASFDYLKKRLPFFEQVGFVTARALRKPIQAKRRTSRQTYLGYRIAAGGIMYLAACKRYRPEAFNRIEADLQKEITSRGQSE